MYGLFTLIQYLYYPQLYILKRALPILKACENNQSFNTKLSQ